MSFCDIKHYASLIHNIVCDIEAADRVCFFYSRYLWKISKTLGDKNRFWLITLPVQLGWAMLAIAVLRFLNN